MSKKQDRRGVNLSTDVHEELNCLQAKVRLIMRSNGQKLFIGKTSMTGILEAVIKNTKPEDLAELLSN